jgi:pyruvate carboxylase
MTPKSEIQIKPEWLAPSPEAAIEARFALTEVLEAVGWPLVCKATETGPGRCMLPVAVEALIAAADRLYPEWRSEGQIEFFDVTPS